MTDPRIAHPHDRFMKDLLAHPEQAGTLLRERLPEAVVEFLSAKPPELVDASFVDKVLQGHLSDRLFKVETINGKTAFLYVLIEHKSAPDGKVGWQLLNYLVEILKQWVRENPKWERLPAIVPFVFYHGEREWKLPKGNGSSPTSSCTWWTSRKAGGPISSISGFRCWTWVRSRIENCHRIAACMPGSWP